MCVDYTDLNKHCPKDHFGLPCIDQVVDLTAGCVLLCILDCYSGYHQIALKEEDQIKTTFITSFGTYAYKSRPLGSKMQEQPINAQFRCASLISCIGILRPTWMTWSSIPGIPMT
jgi:hypothetical protein